MTELVDEYPFGAGLGRGACWLLLWRQRCEIAGLFAEVQPQRVDAGRRCAARRALRAGARWSTLFGDLALIRSLADPEDRLVATIVVAANVGDHRARVHVRPVRHRRRHAVLVPRRHASRRDGRPPAHRLNELVNRRRRSHSAWRHGCSELRARPLPGCARRSSPGHAPRLARPGGAANRESARGVAASQPASAGQPASVADWPARLAAPPCLRACTSSSTAGTAALDARTGSTISTRPTRFSPPAPLRDGRRRRWRIAAIWRRSARRSASLASSSATAGGRVTM